MSEIFNEVDEELRREQLKKLWDRYSIFIVAAAILVVAAVGGWRGYQYLEAQKAAEAGSAFEAAVSLAEQGKSAEAEAAFSKIATEGAKGYRGLARLRAAAEAATRDPQAAGKLYDAIIADTSLSSSEQDLARIRAGGLLIETEPYAAMRQRLEPATGEGRTYRHTARELLALSAWRANDAVAARQWLDMIGNDARTPASMRSRAEALQALLPPAAKS
ncbi:MAG: tetratricopeptide repeat protein [Afipia sp.]|nr:tetratricopeptide repeat protein [Afipia sp.]